MEASLISILYSREAHKSWEVTSCAHLELYVSHCYYQQFLRLQQIKISRRNLGR